MRSIWKGSISFGLINIPVRIYTATQESSLDLTMLDSKDHSNIKFKRVNENTGKEVEFKDIVKGYRINDQYVILDEEDFKAADALKTKTIEIQNFVDQKQIDSIYFENPYYLEPEEGAMKAYALLRDALKSAGKVGITTFVLRNKEALAILKPYEKVIVLNKIRFTQEIRATEELKLPEVSKAKSKELDMAKMLIDQLTEKFDISKFEDTYTAKLLKIIDDKSKGKKTSVPHLRVVHPQKDLMSMLKASLETKKKRAS